MFKREHIVEGVYAYRDYINYTELRNTSNE